MRHLLMVGLVVALAMAGCFGSKAELTDCEGPEEVTLYLDADRRLRQEPPAAGNVALEGFTGAFVVEPPTPWLSAPLAQGVALVGNITIELWAEPRGPAPVVDPSGPQRGYHWYNQFGSDLALLPDGAVDYQDTITAPGGVQHVTETIPLPAGGFRIERDQAVRLQLTSLAVPGHDVLVGGEQASHVRFMAVCIPATRWTPVDFQETSIAIPGNRGLLSGAVPAAEDVNQETVPFALAPGTDRLVIELRQSGPMPIKDDMDLVLLDSSGEVVWRGGSPSADEAMAMWRSNLDLLAPPGDYVVRVDSYSGSDYQGRLTVSQERAA